MIDRNKKKKPEEKADVCVLIPAYNEVERIGDVIKRAQKYARRVLVLDDGSTDGTAAAAEKAGAEVIRHPRNLGKGAALRDGFEHFLKLSLPACIVIDGDGQHEPEEIPKFVEEAEETGAGIVVGNRLADRDAMPPVRYNTNWTTSAIISWLIKQRVPDSQCGYRLIKKEVLREISFTTRNYDTESEMLIEAGRRGYKIGSVPIKCIYSGQVSKIDPGRDTLRFIRLVLRNLPPGKKNVGKERN